MKVPQERRARMRLPVRWPLRILSSNGSGQPLEGITENLSSQGFYCWVSRAFAPGDSLRCLIELPSRLDTPRRLVLSCEAEVVRSERSSEAGLFGVACRIVEYQIVIHEHETQESAPG